MKRPYRIRKRKYDYCAKCPKGLWAVCGTDRKSVERDAAHYWSQYAADGEYEATKAEGGS
jgi:hypothetical protein